MDSLDFSLSMERDDDLQSTESLSRLSAQLMAHGHITRPLELVSLFHTNPSPPSTASAEAYQEHVDRLRAESLARDQVVKCLWNVLQVKAGMNEELEELRRLEKVGLYERERLRKMVDAEKKERDRLAKEAEGDRIRAKAALESLQLEQTKHKQAREDLSKSRTALQLVRTQAGHDIKRREQEAATTIARLQRLTAAPSIASTRLILNQPLPTLSSTTNGRRRAPLSPTSSENEGSAPELALVEEALLTCEEERKLVLDENKGLRELVCEVGEWCEGIVAGVSGFEKVVDEKDGAEDEVDESFMVPQPHLAQPLPALVNKTQSSLDHIRTRLLTVVGHTDELLVEAQKALRTELDEEKGKREEEEEKRRSLEEELEIARETIEQNDQLVSDFAVKGGFFAQAEGKGKGKEVVYGDESMDSPGSTTKIREEEQRKLTARVQMAKERARVEADQKEKDRRREVERMLGALEDDEAESEAPAPAPAPSSASLRSSASSSKPSSLSGPSSSKPISATSRAMLSPLVEASSTAEMEEALPSLFTKTDESVFAPAISEVKSVRERGRGALAGILAMANDGGSGTKMITATNPPSARGSGDGLAKPTSSSSSSRPVTSAPFPTTLPTTIKSTSRTLTAQNGARSTKTSSTPSLSHGHPSSYASLKPRMPSSSSAAATKPRLPSSSTMGASSVPKVSATISSSATAASASAMPSRKQTVKELVKETKRVLKENVALERERS